MCESFYFTQINQPNRIINTIYNKISREITQNEVYYTRHNNIIRIIEIYCRCVLSKIDLTAYCKPPSD